MMMLKAGDLVRLSKNEDRLGLEDLYDFDAVVVCSYADRFGGENTKDYVLFFRHQGEVAWFAEDNLQIIDTGREALLREWVAEKEEDRKRKADLDWIFSNAEDVMNTASLQTLAKCLDIEDLWGEEGEGYTWWQLSHIVINHARPFLDRGDKEGWLRHCETVQKPVYLRR